MSYLYSGDLNLSQFIEDQIKMKIAKSKKLPEDGMSSSYNTINNNQTHLNMAVDLLIDFLRVSDEYLLEELKNNCQAELIKLIDEYTYHTISEMGELYNADRIVDYCQWFKRRKLSMLYGYENHLHQSTITTTTNEIDLNQINSSSADNNQIKMPRNDKVGKVTGKPPSPPLSDTSCIASESATGSNVVRNSLTSIIPQKSKH